jgi:hypothetical protein
LQVLDNIHLNTGVKPIPGESGRQVMNRLPVLHIESLYDPKLKGYAHRYISLFASMLEITLPGDFAQFGVWKGQCARYMQHFLTSDRILHLFDSFEGLPEDWLPNVGKGSFNVKGKLPEVDEDKTRIHKGWFKDTVPGFAESLQAPLSFLHIDCDLYSSTMDVLNPLNSGIAPGTLLLFDEYILHQSEDEHKALIDWANEHDRQFEYLWRNKWVQVAVRITK